MVGRRDVDGRGVARRRRFPLLVKWNYEFVIVIVIYHPALINRAEERDRSLASVIVLNVDSVHRRGPMGTVILIRMQLSLAFFN